MATEYIQKAALAASVPIVLATGATLVRNFYDPVAQVQISNINQQYYDIGSNIISYFSSGSMTPIVGQESTSTVPKVFIEVFGIKLEENYLYYTIIYFSTLFGFIFGLEAYNIAKMFGWDEAIGATGKELINWFLTPPTREEKEALDAARAGRTNEEEAEDPFAKKEE